MVRRGVRSSLPSSPLSSPTAPLPDPPQPSSRPHGRPPLFKGTYSDQRVREKSLFYIYKPLQDFSIIQNIVSDNFWLLQNKFGTKSTKNWKYDGVHVQNCSRAMQRRRIVFPIAIKIPLKDTLILHFKVIFELNYFCCYFSHVGT